MRKIIETKNIQKTISILSQSRTLSQNVPWINRMICTCVSCKSKQSIETVDSHKYTATSAANQKYVSSCHIVVRAVHTCGTYLGDDEHGDQ